MCGNEKEIGTNSLRAGEENSKPKYKYTVWHYDEFLFEIGGNATREEIEKIAWEEYGISAGGIQIYEKEAKA
jgi:hypothetical protein